ACALPAEEIEKPPAGFIRVSFCCSAELSLLLFEDSLQAIQLPEPNLPYAILLRISAHSLRLGFSPTRAGTSVRDGAYEGGCVVVRSSPSASQGTYLNLASSLLSQLLPPHSAPHSCHVLVWLAGRRGGGGEMSSSQVKLCRAFSYSALDEQLGLAWIGRGAVLPGPVSLMATDNSSDLQNRPPRQLETALGASGVAVILLAGAAANAVALALTLRRGAQSKLHSIFVGNLALADLLVTLLTPAAWYFYVWPPAAGHSRAARWTEAAVQAAQSASVCAVVAVTIDRTCLVFRPIKYRLSHRRLTPMLLAGLAWVLCTVGQAPRLGLGPDGRRLFQRLHIVAEFAAALCALAVCNFTICRQIERSRKLKFLRRHSGYSTDCGGGGGGGSTRQLLTTGKPCGPAARKCSVPVNVGQTAAAAATSAGAAKLLERPQRRNTLCDLGVVGCTGGAGPVGGTATPLHRGDTRLSLQSMQRLSLDANSRRYARQRDSEEVINEILAKQHRRALRTLVLLVLLFVVCRAPRAALSGAEWLGLLPAGLFRPCSFYLELLVHLNSVLDPFAYVFCGNRLCHRRTRAGFKAAGGRLRACCCRCCRGGCVGGDEADAGSRSAQLFSQSMLEFTGGAATSLYRSSSVQAVNSASRLCWPKRAALHSAAAAGCSKDFLGRWYRCPPLLLPLGEDTMKPSARLSVSRQAATQQLTARRTLSMRAARGIINVSAAGLFIRVRSDLITNSGRAHPHRRVVAAEAGTVVWHLISMSFATRPPIYTDLDRTDPLAERGLVKVPEGFFSAEHPNTKMMANLLMQGDYTRLRSLMDRSNAGATAIFQVADRGCQNNKRSMFHRQAVLYLSLVGLAIYFNKGSAASLLIKEGGAALLRSQFATGVQSSDDILTFPAEYIAVLMESFDCVAPLIRLRFWEPYETSSLLYRRRYLQMRTPIVGYPDLLRCALLRNPNYNLSGFLISARRETTNFSLSRLIYLGSIMVQHFDIDFSASVGIRRTFDATSGPRFVLPNLCSLQRRLLTLAVYQDPNGRLLSQVLAGLKECNQAGAHLVTMLPQAVGGSLLLWLQELVSAEHNGQLFRCLGARTEKLLQSEPDDAFTPRCLRDHYLRYDALNCLSLLLSLLARHKVGRMDSLGFARRIMDAACGISIQVAGLAIPLFSYAWPDHLLALASLVNPLTPAGGVGFEEFARLLQHLPGYASAAGYGATDKWRASIRKSIL
uniref:G_PROTEIN_RECEP_F1_2 domain-containing protein n=1 Tax=Macrostomum lignano TaxID=282301 RepID=A0A1I8INS2_9PLAT